MSHQFINSNPTKEHSSTFVFCQLFIFVNTLLVFFSREFLRLGNPLNCGAWDKKLLKQYRVHKPSSLGYDAEMRSKSIKSESQWYKSRVLCCLLTSESILKSHIISLIVLSSIKHMVIVSISVHLNLKIIICH